MTSTPAPRHPVAGVTLTPFSDAMACLSVPEVNGALSGTWSSQVAMFFPIYLRDPYPVVKAFWCNGSTVGTDSIDLGVYRMTDQTTGSCDLIRSTGAVLSAGTVSVVQEVSAWKVARAAITNNFSDADATSYATASVTLKAGRLYLMVVQNAKASADVVSVISGGPTFTSRATTQYNGTANRISVWSAVPAADYTGTLTIDFGGGNTQTACIWSLIEMSGVDTSTADGVVQAVVGTGNSTTPLATLAAFGSANNATFGAFASINTTAHTVGSGFTQLSQTVSATPAARLTTEWRVDNDTTVDGTVTSSQWGAIAVEVKADASAFVIPPSVPGNPAIYMAMTVSGSTATFLRDAPTTVMMRAAGCMSQGATFPLPSSLLVTGTVPGRRPLAGFSLRSLIG